MPSPKLKHVLYVVVSLRKGLKLQLQSKGWTYHIRVTAGGHVAEVRLGAISLGRGPRSSSDQRLSSMPDVAHYPVICERKLCTPDTFQPGHGT